MHDEAATLSVSRRFSCLALGLLVVVGAARSQQTSSIAPEVAAKVAVLRATAPKGDSLSEVIVNDLNRTDLLEASELDDSPDEIGPNSAGSWLQRGFTHVIGVSHRPGGEGQLDFRFSLYDLKDLRALSRFSYLTTPDGSRAVAHRMADLAIDKLTGARGVSASKLAVSLQRGDRFEIVVFDADFRNARAVTSAKAPMHSLSWSPDGGQLAFVSHDTGAPRLIVQLLVAGTSRSPLSVPLGSEPSLAWEPRGQRLFYGENLGGRGYLRAISLHESTEPMELKSIAGGVWHVAAADDGSGVFLAAGEGADYGIHRFDSRTGALERALLISHGRIGALAVIPGSGSVAFVWHNDSGSELRMLDTATKALRTIATSRRFDSLAVAPDGRMLGVVEKYRESPRLVLLSLRGRMMANAQSTSIAPIGVAWGPAPQ